MMLARLRKGQSALIEVLILFLPGIPAVIWLWPNIDGRFSEIAQIVVYLYLLAGGLWIGLRRWNLAELGFTRQGLWLSLGCGLLIILGRLLVILGIDWLDRERTFSYSRLFGEFLFYFGLVGLVEEYMFRGLVYQALDSWLGARYAIWGSTLGFILFHIGWRSPLMGLAALLMGLIFALIRWRAGSIIGLIIIHAVMDITSVELLPNINLEQLGAPVIHNPGLVILGYVMLLAVPLYLWLIFPRAQRALPQSSHNSTSSR